MRILYVITQADGGGAQKYALALAKHFGGAIAVGNEAAQLFEQAKNLQLTTYNLSHLKRKVTPWHDIMAIWEIRQLIKAVNPDIIHLNSSKAGILGSFASIGLKKKVIFTAHGFVFNEPLPWAIKSFYLSLEKTASSYRDYIICVSQNDKDSALANNLIAPKKLSIIHNGIGPINFIEKSAAKTELKLDANKLVIGCVAGFYKTKGVDVLIDAIGLLVPEAVSKIQLAIIGSGPEEVNLKFKIENLKLDSEVILLGRINNAANHLKAFDIFVLPSRKEGFPFALLEAMQAALPIIATNVGGNPEALGDAGILVEPENPKALAEALNLLITKEQKRKDLSQKSLERSQLFTEEKMFEETKKVYELLISK